MGKILRVKHDDNPAPAVAPTRPAAEQADPGAHRTLAYVVLKDGWKDHPDTRLVSEGPC